MGSTVFMKEKIVQNLGTLWLWSAVFCLKLFVIFAKYCWKFMIFMFFKVPYTNSVNSRIESCSHTLQRLLFIYFSLLIDVVFYVTKNLPTLFFLSICNVGSQLFGGLNKFLQNMSKWYLILVRQMLKYISEYNMVLLFVNLPVLLLSWNTRISGEILRFEENIFWFCQILLPRNWEIVYPDSKKTLFLEKPRASFLVRLNLMIC